jgi:hypothetical protein
MQNFRLFFSAQIAKKFNEQNQNGNNIRPCIYSHQQQQVRIEVSRPAEDGRRTVAHPLLASIAFPGTLQGPYK